MSDMEIAEIAMWRLGGARSWYLKCLKLGINPLDYKSREDVWQEYIKHDSSN